MLEQGAGMMDDELTATAAGSIYFVSRSNTTYKVVADELFVQQMTNQVETIDGTLGELHRRHLHQLLDEWINHVIWSKD